jgi:hypothetical protein
MDRTPKPNLSRRGSAGEWARERANRAMDAGLRAFYAADPRRGGSRERDLGLTWRSVHGTTYRAAWIVDTEELYTVRHSGDTDDAEVRVLARLGSEAVDRALAGWRRICAASQPGSYEWLAERVRGASGSTAPAF